jgi:hypothetical protein
LEEDEVDEEVDFVAACCLDEVVVVLRLLVWEDDE